MGRERKTIPLGIGGLSVEIGAHVAYFWETREDFERAVDFLEHGIRRGEHAVVFGHQDANARICDVLEARGHSCGDLQQDNRLSVLGPDQTGERILNRIGETFQAALDAGAPMIRLLGNIGWGKLDWPDEADLLRFEARVTQAAASFPCVIVCMYDLSSLSGSVVFHGAFCTHPLTIYRGNLVRENPMCVSVEEFLERMEKQVSGPA